MAETVYLLGAGFSVSLMPPGGRVPAPLTTNFFQVALNAPHSRYGRESIAQRPMMSNLLAQIERYWHLDLAGLASQPFDLEECLTFLESRLGDLRLSGTTTDETTQLERAISALRLLLMEYLNELGGRAHGPIGKRFGDDVLTSNADVITFNYDILAEENIALSSGISSKYRLPMGPDEVGPGEEFKNDYVTDAELDTSHFQWKAMCAAGFAFDDLDLPIAGTPWRIEGERYYSHPNNQLYRSTRVLKLHGSITWLRYGNTKVFDLDPHHYGPPPKPFEIAYESHPMITADGILVRGGLMATPVIIPPLLNKRFDEAPFPAIWQEALTTLSECDELYVIGYSFPPTDFRTKRLVLEAFADHAPNRIVVVNPDPSIVDIVRKYTRYAGPIERHDSLSAYYGLPFTLEEMLDQVRARTRSPSDLL